MKADIKELVRTDLIQAKILIEHSKLSNLKLLFLFVKSRTCRIHFFVRLRQSNKIISTIAKIYLDRYFIEIGKHTQIGEHFYMPHPRGIIIANDVKLGSHVHVGQYVTIGGSFKRKKIREDGSIQKSPIIGSNVVIAHGAVVGGPVTIGNNVIVGANAVVTKDVVNNKIVNGNNYISNRKIKVFNSCDKFEYID